eukprot:5046455-Prymnesium_polylepis.1
MSRPSRPTAAAARRPPAAAWRSPTEGQATLGRAPPPTHSALARRPRPRRCGTGQACTDECSG